LSLLMSVNVGRPREISWRGQIVYTSVWKEPVQGRRLVRRLNIDGDAQGDLAGHGGEQRAVFVYQMDSYRYWQRELKRADFTFGHSEKTSPLRVSPIARSTSATATGSAGRCLKSHSRV
jgi:MOSC domain-containing protein YiiM